MSGGDLVKQVEADLVSLGRELGIPGDRAQEAGKVRVRHVAFLVVDCSESMAERDKVRQARDGGRDFAREAVGKGFEVGLVFFSSRATLVSEPTRNTAAVARSLDALEAGGGTDMAPALSLALFQLEEVRGRRAIVVVTDGQTENRTEVLKLAREAKKRGVAVLAVGTDDADRAFLASIVTDASLAQHVPDGRLSAGIRRAAGLLP